VYQIRYFMDFTSEWVLGKSFLSAVRRSHTLFVWKIYIMGEMRGDNVDVHVRKNMPHADAYS
jgi:hypothetical protein